MSDVVTPAPLPASRLFDLAPPSGPGQPVGGPCSLFDVPCHFQNAVWEAWAGLGLGWQAVIVLCLLALILGALRGFLGLVKTVAGWPGVAGVVGLVLAGIFMVLPRKPQGRRADPVADVGKKGREPFAFGVDRVRKGKRRFNLDTKMWEWPD